MTENDVVDEEPTPKEERVPVDMVMPGLQLHPLGEGEAWQWAFVLMKVKDRDGDDGWSYRTSAPPNRVELLGALRIQVAILERELLDEWD